MIKRFVHHYKKPAFVVEHDLLMASYLADRVVVFGPTGGASAASAPGPAAAGLNGFLAGMGVTFRRDPNNGR